MATIISFSDAMKAAGKNASLMIANGFSIKHFRYANLLEKAGLQAGSPLRRLFDVLSTVGARNLTHSQTFQPRARGPSTRPRSTPASGKSCHRTPALVVTSDSGPPLTLATSTHPHSEPGSCSCRGQTRRWTSASLEHPGIFRFPRCIG
jgi:hypothetical protein